MRQKLGEPLGSPLDGQPPPVPRARGLAPRSSPHPLPPPPRSGFICVLLRRHLPSAESHPRHQEHSGGGTRTLGSSNPKSSGVVTVPPDLPSLCLCPERGPAVRPPPGCSPARPRPSGLSDPARAQAFLVLRWLTHHRYDMCLIACHRDFIEASQRQKASAVSSYKGRCFHLRR